MSRATAYRIGVDLGGTNIQAGVLDADGTLLHRDRCKTKAKHGAEAVLERIAGLVERLIVDAGIERGHVAAVGVGAPGAIDVERGVVVNAVNLRWTDLPVAARLADRLGLPVTLDNDVNVGAWGEHAAGAAKGHDDVLAVFVGTGIGGGLILNGRLYRGAHCTAGEIGHTILNADAPLGQRTLEDLASRSAIVRRLVQLIESNHPSDVAERVGGKWEKVRSRVLAEAAAAGDPLTLELLDDAAHYLGTALANAVTLLSIPCVVLGGGLVDALGEPWVERVRERYHTRVFPPSLGETSIVPGALGDDAGLIGAALLAGTTLTQSVGSGHHPPTPEKS